MRSTASPPPRGWSSAAAVIMFAVFAAFVPDGEGRSRPIAFGLAVGVFVDAFVVRMTLVPAVMALLGRSRLVAAGLDRPPAAVLRRRGRRASRSTSSTTSGSRATAGAVVRAEELAMAEAATAASSTRRPGRCVAVSCSPSADRPAAPPRAAGHADRPARARLRSSGRGRPGAARRGGRRTPAGRRCTPASRRSTSSTASPAGSSAAASSWSSIDGVDVDGATPRTDGRRPLERAARARDAGATVVAGCVAAYAGRRRRAELTAPRPSTAGRRPAPTRRRPRRRLSDALLPQPDPDRHAAAADAARLA